MTPPIRCGSSWDDAAYACKLLRLKQEERALVATAGGEEALALAAAGVDRVVYAHPDPAEVAVLDLKLAAAPLAHARFRTLLGLEPGDAEGIYEELRSSLPETSRAFWDSHRELLRRGVHQGGRVETYLQRFRHTVLPRVHDEAAIEAIRSAPDADSLERRYDSQWDGLPWRLAVRGYFSRRWNEGAVRSGGAVLASLRRATVHHGVASNPYVQWLYGDEHSRRQVLPEPLTEDGHASWADRVQHIHTHCADPTDIVGSAEPRSFTAYIVSAASGAIPDGPRFLATAVQASMPRARMVWWAAADEERTWPSALVERVIPTRVLAKQEQADRAWMHGGLRMARMRP